MVTVLEREAHEVATVCTCTFLTTEHSHLAVTLSQPNQSRKSFILYNDDRTRTQETNNM